MYTRRRALAIGAVGIGALSGCTNLASGDGPISREATPAVVSDSVLDETGHELEEQRTKTVSREVEAGGETREIEATNHIAVYTKQVSGPGDGELQGSLFGIVSTPAFEFVGQSFNPIGDYSNQELLDFVSDRFGNLTVDEAVESNTRTVLGTETTVTKFSTTADFNGERIDSYAHVMSVEHESDIIVAVGGYPQELESQEEDGITQLFGGITHQTE